MFKKKKSEKEGKEKSKDDKRKKEKDRKARAERTLSGHEMSSNLANARASGGIVKREKHGLFHSLRKHDRKSHDLTDSSPDSPQENTDVNTSVSSRVNVFEKFNTTSTSTSTTPQPALTKNREEVKRLNSAEEVQKVTTKAFKLQRGSPVVSNSDIQNGVQQKDSGQKVMEVQQDDINTVQTISVSSEYPLEATKQRVRPKVAAKPKYNAVTSNKKECNIFPDILPPTERQLDVKGVSLSLPEVKTGVEGLPRLCIIRRQANGGFGFALRRQTTSNNKDIYLAEPLEDSSTSLLPGDQLLEVNGHNVDGLSREEIVELVSTSKSEVRLKVVPIPELAELTSRSGLDGGRVQVDETYLKSGSLVRSGSMRMKKKTKTEAEVASEKEWLDAEKVWVVHKGGFSGGRMLKQPPDESDDNDITTCKVKLDQGGEILDVEEDTIEKANPPRYDRAEDLAALRHLNEPSCLHALRQRYGSSLIHTYAGQILVILNPIKQLNIYTDKVIQMFRGCKQEDMPPHIYASAQTTYRNMLATNSDQSIVLMGPSGSGKSVNFSHLLHYFCTTSVSPNSSLTAVKNEALLKLLDAFGNCQTRLNANASRFTMLFTLDYDSSGLLTSGSLQTFLLEKTRIIRRAEQESTFKIFRYFLAGCNKKLRQEFHLDVAEQDKNSFIEADPDIDQQASQGRWNELQHALDMLGVSNSEVKCLWCIIAAVYHLGTAGITIGNDNEPRFTNPAGVQRAALVLGVTVEDISEFIFTPPTVSQIIVKSPRNRKAGRLSSQSSETSSTPVDKQATSIENPRLTQCLEALQGLAMGLYQQAFAILIFFINRSIQEGDPRRIASINILDSAGFSDTTLTSGNTGASFEDFCYNYQSERLQKFFHNIIFTQQLARYNQENVDCNFDTSISGSPERVVTTIDKAAQGGGLRLDIRNEKKGLLWLLDEESIFPGSTTETFLKRLCDQRQSGAIIKAGVNDSSFYLNHFQCRQPILYNAQGWLRYAREHPAIKQAQKLLSDSTKDDLVTLSLRHADGLSRTRSFYRKTSTTMSVKKDSQCLQLIYQVDNVLDCIRKTHITFIRCMLPFHGAARQDTTTSNMVNQTSTTTSKMDVPLLRDQFKRAQILDAVRLHRQGYPEHMTFGEFQHRFSILAPAESRQTQPILDEKKAAESLLELLDVDSRSYKIGLSQIFLRAGTLAQLEDTRDETITDKLIELQAYCRGYLSRKKREKLKVQQKAIRCIQRNVRQFLTVREWEWWRLYTKIIPLLDVHRTDEELRAKTDELGLLKSKVTKLESENRLLLENNAKLDQKVSELTSILDDERASGHGTLNMLQEEQVLRIRAEKEIENLKSQIEVATKNELGLRQNLIKAETITMTEAAMPETSINHDGIDDKDGQIVNMSVEKRQVERMLSDKDSENEELLREISTLKRKVTRTTAEMGDMKLLLEKSQSRNAELEKKQRRFDADMARLREECKSERNQKEKITREKDLCVAERIQLENDLDRYRSKMEDIRNEKERLEYDLSSLSKNKDGGAQAVEMASSNRQLEKTIEEQEEELDEQAGQIQLLEQAKLRLEMEIEQMKKRAQKEIERNEEDLEEMKSNYVRKIKQLEAQLEDEHTEITQAVRLRQESDRKLMELRTTLEQVDQHSGKKYKQDLRSTKALLHDAQVVIDQLTQQTNKDKTQIKQLKHQLDDEILATQNGLKSKKQLEIDVQEIQTQYDIMVRNKMESDEKCSSLAREINELKSQIEDDDEEMNGLLQKIKTLISENGLLQSEKSDLIEEKHELKRQNTALSAELTQLKNRCSYVEETFVENNVHEKVGIKVKELQHKLESSLTNYHRLEVQNERLKESLHKAEEEKIVLSEKESKFYQEKNKMEKKLSETREELAVLQKQESEQKKRRIEKENELQDIEAVLATTKTELSLTKKRLADLQQTMEDNLNSDSSDVDTDSSSDDDDNDHVSMTSSRAFSETHLSSEPRSYKSYEDLDDVDDVTDKLTKRLNALGGVTSPTNTDEKPVLSDDASVISDSQC